MGYPETFTFDFRFTGCHIRPLWNRRLAGGVWPLLPWTLAYPFSTKGKWCGRVHDRCQRRGDFPPPPSPGKFAPSTHFPCRKGFGSFDVQRTMQTLSHEVAAWLPIKEKALSRFLPCPKEITDLYQGWTHSHIFSLLSRWDWGWSLIVVETYF